MRPSLFNRSLLFTLFFIVTTHLSAQIIVREATPEYIVKTELVGENPAIQIENIQFEGASEALALFYNPSNNLPVNKGFVLTTGIAKSILGPNKSATMGSPNNAGSNKWLEYLANGETFDASVLSFDFYSNSTRIEFAYFFASEEYPEYVNKGVNDVFAFFVQHHDSVPYNIALLPNSNLPVSVDNVNQYKNATLFTSSHLWNPYYFAHVNPDTTLAKISYAFEFDGFTNRLVASAQVRPYQKYRLSLAIADVGDDIYDSGVLIERQSFKSTGEMLSINDVIFDDSLKTSLKGIQGEIVNRVEDSLVFAMPLNFAFNDTVVDSSYYVFLDLMVNRLSHYFDVKVMIVGHTDAVGSDSYNQQLSEKRARSIAAYLSSKGLPVNRITTLGKGSTEPLSKTEYSKNRRVEYVLYR